MQPVFHDSIEDLEQSAKDLAAMGGRALAAMEEVMQASEIVRHKSLSNTWRTLNDQGFVIIRERFDICGAEYTISSSVFGEEALECLWEMRETNKKWPGKKSNVKNEKTVCSVVA